MEREFVSYEIALALKELGFDEPCFGRWLIITEWEAPTGEIRLQLGAEAESYDKNQCTAPLYQQAFRWFREKHNLKGHIEAVEYLDGTPDTYHWSIFNKCNSGYDQLTYEEAELECLKKLIEIVKNKQ
jgi:hypothetical protein